MTFRSIHFFLLAISLPILCIPEGISQESRLFTPVNISNACQSGTRSPDGKPGDRYWQNRADYTLAVTFDPKTLIVSGQGTITYINNSPDTLNKLLLMLLPDMYKAGNARDFNIAKNDEHGGVVIRDLRIGSREMDASRTSGSQVVYENTSAWIALPDRLLPGSSLSLSMSWEYPLNEGSPMRTGQVDPSSFFIAYWFPRIGVYDDIDGWNNYIYSGVGEFYNDFGDFDVRITAPAGFLVWATGELQNPTATFSEKVLSRYELAKKSADPVHIVVKEDLKESLTAKKTGSITWNYKASNVSDFAFALSDHYLWDALSMDVGIGGNPVFVSAAYNPESSDFYQVISMAKTAMTYMAEELPGLPFPYPCITVFNGLDEMEYPMMVNDLSNEDLAETFKLTAHEICHSYFPFFLGCNERKYAWMDEGLTSFFEYNMIKDLMDSTATSIYFLEDYLDIRGTERDIPLFIVSEIVREPEYYAISYAKAVCFYSILMNETGRETFREALQEFATHWEGRHPTGHDLINTMTKKTGRDLGWLFQPWMFEFGKVDLGIGDVTRTQNGYLVTIEKSGNLPAPVNLLATFVDGQSTRIKMKPSVWSEGANVTLIELNTDNDLKELELLQDIPMDCNAGNDIRKL